MSGSDSSATLYTDRSRGLRGEREFDKPVQRLRATVEPFSHVSCPQDRGRSHTFSAHAGKEGTHFAVKEQVNSSMLTQSSGLRTPVMVTYPPKSATLDQRTLLPWKGGCTDTVGSAALPNEVHSSSTAPWSSSLAQELTPTQHNHVTEQTPEDRQQQCSTPINRGTLGQRDRFSRKDPDLVKYSKLESQVQVQADVNKELKRLLVASIGNDLQHRVSQIVQEKAVTSHRLDTSLQQLTENEEEMDRLNIECDIWRSKFLASRLMIDELAAWKTDVMRKLRESQRALQQLLQEQLEIKRILQAASGCSEGNSYRRNSSEWTSVPQERSVLDLARDLSVNSKTLMVQNGDSGGHAGEAGMEQLMPTSGEVLALQVLSNGGQPSNVYSSQNLPFPLKLSKGHLPSRSNSSPRLHQSLHYVLGTESHSIQFHCGRCKGKIYHV